MDSNFQGITERFLYWITNNIHTDYNHLVLMKNMFTDAGSIILGFLFGVILTAFIIKDAQWVPDSNADKIKITEMTKQKRFKMFVIVPEKQFPNMKTITVVVIFLYAVLVRFFPFKQLHFLDNFKLRIGASVFIILVIAFCIFNISLDGHLLLQSKDGKYIINDLLK